MSTKPLLQRLSELLSQHPQGIPKRDLRQHLPEEDWGPAYPALDWLAERGYAERRQVRKTISFRYHHIKPYEPGRRDLDGPTHPSSISDP